MSKTKERMGKLETAIERLTQAQTRTEERMGRLEIAIERLAQAQTRTEERVSRLETATERLTRAQQELTRAQQELAQAQQELTQAQQKLAQAQTRTERAVRNLAIQVGRLTDTVGYGLEDIAKVVLPGYLKAHYNVQVEKLERRFFEVKGKLMEINLYGEGLKDGKKLILLGEVKSKIHERDVINFIKNTDKLIQEFKVEVLKIMFGYFIHPSATKLAEREKIVLVASYQK